MTEKGYMEPFECVLVSPEKTIYSGMEPAVQIPTSKGDTVILEGHAPMVIGIVPGLIRLMVGGKNHVKDYFVGGGFAEVTNTKTVILASFIEPVSQMYINELDLTPHPMSAVVIPVGEPDEEQGVFSENTLTYAKKEAGLKASVPFKL